MTILPPLLAGNWKMNGMQGSLSEIEALRDAVTSGRMGRAETLICPPFTLLRAAADLCRGAALGIGGQDCDPKPSGAFTGNISADMLRDAGATAVIVGHSERRTLMGETDALVHAKADAAARAGLLAIICVGETRDEHDRGETLQVIGRQIDESVPRTSGAGTIAVAYEPVWAIGTGLVPSAGQIVDVHGFLRQRLEGLLSDRAGGVRLLYGGSVKPDNAEAIGALSNVDGMLVGGASLKAKDFIEIAAAYR